MTRRLPAVHRALCALAAAAGCAAPGGPAPCEPPSAWDATGFFRVADACGAPVLVDPDGRRFYSFGVNDVRFDGDWTPSGKNPYRDAVQARYGSRQAWAAAAAERLQGWGFNTAGSWSDGALLKDALAWTETLNLSGADWRTGATPDYFAPAWAEAVRQRAAAQVQGKETARTLLGWFLDNELHWGPDWRLGTELFDEYLAMPEAAPGRRALLALLEERHGGDIASFNAAWGTAFGTFAELAQATTLPRPERMPTALKQDREAFLRAVAERYFSVTTAAVRAVDPNHLLLGTRAVSVLMPKVVVEEAGRFVDVLSVNAYVYELDPATVWPPARYGFLPVEQDGFLRAFHLASGRPVLVSEFGFRAKDSGLPNAWPPVYPVLATQEERAARYQEYARRCFAAPWVVGFHWYKYQDQPPEGRFDGENNNWGLVDLQDEPWTALTSAAAAVHAERP